MSLTEDTEAAICQCPVCRDRRRESTIVALRECVRVRTEERDELKVRVERQSAELLGEHKRGHVLERRNKALSEEVELLECDCLALRDELETR